MAPKKLCCSYFHQARNSIIVKGLFLYFGYERKCALFEYRSRRLNIKLLAAVVYFCLVDCYSCIKCKND